MQRSFHFIPAHKDNLFPKLGNLGADHYILDLEDAVPKADKPQARKNLLELFSKPNLPKNLWLRANNVDSEYFADDLAVIEKFPEIGIVIPKVENSLFVTSIPGDRKIIILIESLLGLERLSTFVDDNRVYGVGLGLEDMLAKFLISNDKLLDLSKHIRTKFISTAKIYDKVCLDGVSVNFHDTDSFKKESKESRHLGFDGRFSIHPNQVESINESYSIDESLIEWSEKITKSFNDNLEVGYALHDGVLITPPKLKKAIGVLEALKGN